MALKRLPADLTFDAIRNQSSPLASGFAVPADSDKGHAKPSRKTAEPVEGAAAPDTRAPVLESPAAHTPATSQADRGPLDVPAVHPQSTKPAIESKTETRQTRVTPQTPPRPRSETVVIKGHLLPPAEGLTRVYDAVKARHGEKIAFKHLLGLALGTYADAILAGDHHALVEQAGFAPDPQAHVTYRTRSVPKPFFEAVRSVLDPYGIMGPSVLGTAIMKNAIGWYIARNARGSSTR